jgi:hypothetical protein
LFSTTPNINFYSRKFLFMRHPYVSLFIILFFYCSNSLAQNESINQANTIIKAGQDIKNLFGKKKHKAQDTTSVLKDENASGSVLDFSRAGEVAPNAKILDVDELFYFSQGAALVRKGTSTALIDNAGNFIVPFNKYQISAKGIRPLGFDAAGYHHGIFVATEISTNRQGVLNSKGVFYPLADLGSAYMCGPYIAIRHIDQTYTYIDHDWHVYNMTKPFLNFREGVGASYTGDVNAPGIKYGYKKITGQYVISPQYDFAGEFWDGRAVIGKINIYGEMKYGFIDIAGTEIFPCVLSMEPSHFSSGLARVEPKDKTEYDYAFINRDGKIVIKLRTTKGFFKQFSNGYAMWQDVLDSTGRIISASDFLKRFGIESHDYFFIPEEDVYSLQSCDDVMTEKFYYTALNENKQRFCAAFFDVKTGKKIKPVFEVMHLQGNIQFDKTAKLSYAKIMIGQDQQHYLKDIYREGYIDENGEFVIIKKEGSQW